MNSYNHYAFGSVVAWVYRSVAGIDTTSAAPGYREIVIHPHLDSRITRARGEYQSLYGKIVSDWNGTSAGPFVLNVTIPANTTAKVYLPALAAAHVSQDGRAVAAKREGDAFLVDVGSGSHTFEVK
jgi:alpha-L-rhamnosidase